MRPRPPLPPGPYLVVGLARSGAAAARMLAAHGEVIGVDAREPRDVEALGGTIELHLDSEGLDLVDRVRTVVKSPRCGRYDAAFKRLRPLPRLSQNLIKPGWLLMPSFARFVSK